MFEYIIVFLILIYGVINYDVKGRIDVNNRWLIFEWLTIILLAGMRYKVGGDSISYYDDFYNKWPTLNEISSYDRGRYGILWVYFIAICKTIVNDFAFLQFAHAIIVNTIFFRFFKKHTEHYFTVIFLYITIYFFRYNTEVLRGALAVGSFLVGYEFLLKRKWVYYFLMCLVAYGFHSESIFTFVVPLLLLLKKVHVTQFFVLVLVTISVSFAISVNLMPFIVRIFVSTSLIEQIDAYKDTGANITFVGYVYTFITTTPYLYLVWNYRNIKSSEAKGLMIVFYFISFQSIIYTHLMQRPMDFFVPIFLVEFANLWNNSSFRSPNSVSKTSRGIVFFMFILVLMIDPIRKMIIDANWMLFYPYSSILDPIDYTARELLYYSKFAQ